MIKKNAKRFIYVMVGILLINFITLGILNPLRVNAETDALGLDGKELVILSNHNGTYKGLKLNGDTLEPVDAKTPFTSKVTGELVTTTDATRWTFEHATSGVEGLNVSGERSLARKKYSSDIYYLKDKDGKYLSFSGNITTNKTDALAIGIYKDSSTDPTSYFIRDVDVTKSTDGNDFDFSKFYVCSGTTVSNTSSSGSATKVNLIKAINDDWELDGNNIAIISAKNRSGYSYGQVLALTDIANDFYDAEKIDPAIRLGGTVTDIPVNEKTSDVSVLNWEFEQVPNTGVTNYSLGGTTYETKQYYIKSVNNGKYLTLDGDPSNSYARLTDERSIVVVYRISTSSSNGSQYILRDGTNISNALSLLDQSNSIDPAIFKLFTGNGTNKLERLFYLARPADNIEQGKGTVNVKTVESVPVDVTIRMFNYSRNNPELAGSASLIGSNGQLKFVFGNGFVNYRPVGNNSSSTIPAVARDGYGYNYMASNATATGTITENKYLYPTKTLNDYPVIEYKENKDAKATDSVNLKKIFDTSDSNIYRGEGSNGAGLFQLDNDGYYYYNSSKNAAYWDGSKFTLYDSVVRPSYLPISGTRADRSEWGTDYDNGEFLPFNKLSTETLSAYDIIKQSDGTTNSYKLKGYGSEENVTDMWFGMETSIDFVVDKNGKNKNGKDSEFIIDGDDDIFAYIDGELVLDLSGTHGPRKGNINLANSTVSFERDYDNTGVKTTTLNLKDIFGNKKIDGKKVVLENGLLNPDMKHTLKYFYLERNGIQSYYSVKFNFNTEIPEKQNTETLNSINPPTGDNVGTYIAICLLSVLGAVVGTVFMAKQSK